MAVTGLVFSLLICVPSGNQQIYTVSSAVFAKVKQWLIGVCVVWFKPPVGGHLSVEDWVGVSEIVRVSVCICMKPLGDYKCHIKTLKFHLPLR